MRLVSWNINSIRLRMPLLKKLVDAVQPDIICLQETKVVDELFPLLDVQALGFGHVLFRGEKSYNGVAILSKVPLKESERLHMTGIDDARHLAATLPGGAELHNFYVPAGGDIPDPEENPKFAHKLGFVDHMHDWFDKQRSTEAPMIAVGDFNIAPLEHDVWSHKQLLKIVSHTPVEVEKLTRLREGLGWLDSSRSITPEPEKLYSWWSYRNRDWKKSNRGRRLDHIWLTPPLHDTLQQGRILRETRDWEKPSDHVPVIVELDI